MPVTLTIKNVADKLVQKLRLRAAANHRSLQGELTAILEEAVNRPSTRAMQDEPPYVVQTAPPEQSAKKPPANGRRMTLAELWDRSRRLGRKSRKESTAIIRTMRDERYGR